MRGVEEDERLFCGTLTYQDAGTMWTHCSTEPLMGLELHLSVYVIYIKISITWTRKKEKDIFQTAAVDSEANCLLPFSSKDKTTFHDISPERNLVLVFAVIWTAVLHRQGLFLGGALIGQGLAMKGGGAGMQACDHVHMCQTLHFFDADILHLFSSDFFSTKSHHGSFNIHVNMLPN